MQLQEAGGAHAPEIRTATGRVVRLRPMEDADQPFLRSLYASTRTEELAQVDWTEERKEAFLSMQFDAQHRYYQEQFPDAAFSVIVDKGAAIGRLYVDSRTDELRLIDIALVPEHRGAGVGSAILSNVLAQALAQGKCVRIHVEKFNPAVALYQRLGFSVVEDRGVYDFMEWAPPDSRRARPATAVR